MGVTREFIDLAISLNGGFYLPYQLQYLLEQLEGSRTGTSALFEA